MLVPVVFALGANTPLYEPLWEHLPGLGETRVPGRLLPIACLCLAALFAYALARLRWRYAALVAVVLVAADARVDAFDPLVADEHNAFYAELRERSGGLLERPVFLPDRQGKRLPLLLDAGAARAAARLLDDRRPRRSRPRARSARR